MRRYMGLILNFYKPYKLYSSLYFLGILFDLAVESFVALSFKFLIDNAISVKQKEVMVLVLVLLLLSTVIAKIGFIIRSFLYAKVATGITKNLRIALYGHLQNRSVQFFLDTKLGDILSHFSTDLASVEALTYRAVPAGAYAVIGIVLNLIIIFILEWRLALISLIGLVFCLTSPYLFSRKAAQFNEIVKATQADLLSDAEESISAQKVIKAFNLQDTFMHKLEGKSSHLEDTGTRAFFFNDLMEITPNLIIELFNVLIIAIGAFMAFNDVISAGTLVSFNSLFIGLSGAVASLTWVFPLFMESSASIKRLQKFMSIEDEAPTSADGNTEMHFEQEIKFDQVSFGYVPNQMTLKALNLVIPKGKSVAIVGSSGSGKSSILNLIMRFYDANSGKVYIDSVDITQISRHNIRNKVGIVLQDNFLFNRSIKDNLSLANEKATLEDMIHASQLAEIHAFIMTLEDQYDTIVGERGGKLSGGQRQRLALARALISDPELLILDEATSALDPKTELAINSTLEKLAEHKTLVAITHRLENITNYDLIYVIEDGFVKESGSHQELMHASGPYAELYDKQHGFIISDAFTHAEIEMERLSKIKLFGKLDEFMLNELKLFFKSEFYDVDHNIIKAGDYGDCFYVIVRGQVVVSVMLESGLEKAVSVLEDGDYFGEIALLKSVPRTATIRAKSPSLILSLKRDHFDQILSKAPSLKREMSEEMEIRLKQLACFGSDFYSS
ncbi:ABC transporter transmembrane domain-containing protein [Fusibacter sp. 3D3]|uniref:ABC transporter transmembrane domain-containing protein n=1 Tax=Fusibacter sp. 3D3 TaxID=1048380 RepID=UPI0008591A8C|nr:ABC transporter transmembrane domain-containing protein [Fusibacter sp. 3D3]GAU76608.1 ABC transporter ATP-binding protein [Fusibacter sp. 3D3]